MFGKFCLLIPGSNMTDIKLNCWSWEVCVEQQCCSLPWLSAFPGHPGSCFFSPANLQIPLLCDTKNTENLSTLSSSMTFLGWCRGILLWNWNRAVSTELDAETARRNWFILCPSPLDLHSPNRILAEEVNILFFFPKQAQGAPHDETYKASLQKLLHFALQCNTAYISATPSQ